MYSVIQIKGIKSIVFVSGNQCISFTDGDPDNTDYQQYLEWVAEGNTALVIEDA